MKHGFVVLSSAVAMFAIVLSQVQQKQTKLNNFQRKLARQGTALAELHRGKGPVRPGDWLASHNEPGQTFQQYLQDRPIRISSKRDTLYVLPLGQFDEKQRRIVDLSAEFLGIYFSCKVNTMDGLSLDDAIPPEARRVHPNWGVRQIKSTFVLQKVLPKRLPKDAVALIALTTSDLYPDDDWNFVFGQAMFKDRVGVWSLYRNGDPDTEFKTCLMRTLKTATHETGHMFSIRHCIAYDCNMCGSNSLTESDRRPVYLCPECLPKVWWATKAKPKKRFEKLKKFCEDNALVEYAKFYEKCCEQFSER